MDRDSLNRVEAWKTLLDVLRDVGLEVSSCCKVGRSITTGLYRVEGRPSTRELV